MVDGNRVAGKSRWLRGMDLRTRQFKGAGGAAVVPWRQRRGRGSRRSGHE